MQPLRSHHRPPRRGFTLLELLLVVGVLALMTAIAWPAATRALDGHRLKRAAERLRIEVNATRVRAIESGVPYQFLYEAGGGRFASIPAERDGVPASDSVVRGAVPTEDDLPRAAGRIDGFAFAEAASPLDPTQQLSSELFAGLDEWRDLASLHWSGPIRFESDGSGEDSELKLIDQERGQSITLTIRGFTGAITVGSLVRESTP